jgi:hypothetical protein
LGELGWSTDRFLNASLFEYNLAVKGYWNNYERSVLWITREILWELIQGNPYYKPEDKPNRKDQIYRLSTDREQQQIKEKDIKKIKEQDLRVFEALNFNK